MTVYRTYIPKQPLSDFVNMFWLYEGYHPSHEMERVLPHGSLELIINLREDRFRVYDQQGEAQHLRGTLVSGAYSKYVVIDTASQASVMGVHFKPGGGFPFFPMPADELKNEVVSLDALWGATARNLRDLLLDAETAKAKFHILEQVLLAQSIRPLTRHPAVAFALKELQTVPHTRTIADVTRHTNLSSRRFIQLFRDEVGLTPKLFCRIRRFQEVLRLINSRQRIEWTDIALACGYFDQAHFIRDFRAFSGLNPTVYLTKRGEHPNHIPLHD